MSQGGEPAALEMRGVSKRFGPVVALRAVDLVLRPGTVHAIVGENGAGKSTLVKVLAGVHRPDQGELALCGRPFRPRRPADALRAGVAMIHQELSLAPDLSVAENVFLGAEPRGPLPGTVDHGKMAAACGRLAREQGFELEPSALVRDLPTASCQLVEVLKALARRARVLVFDEPTSSLGRAEAAALLETVRRLRRGGASIVYISHRLEEVLGLADEVTVLRDGEAVHSAPMGELDVASLVKHMVGRELGELYPARRSRPGPVRLEVDRLASDEGIEGVSFTVRAGEVVGLAGLVGSGRTEVARALMGLSRRTAGRVLWDGRPVEVRSPADAIRAGFAYVTEDRKRTGLCLELSAAWNVTLPCLDRLGMRHIVSPARELRLVSELAARLGVRWAGPSSPVASLSGGNQQKLLLGRALLAEAELVVLDEPTRGIDIAAKAEVYRLLDELAGAGRAVLLVSSELAELLGATDRILVMRRRRLVGELRTAEADQEAIMALAAVGQVAA